VYLLFNHPVEADIGKDATRDLKQAIQVLNLINGLDLDAQQMRLILKNAEENEYLHQKFNAGIHRQEEEMLEVLEEIKFFLQEGKDVPAPVAKRYHHLSTNLKKRKLERDQERKILAQEIENSLESHQLYQLQQFVPCVIPPKGELRIGQAGGHQGLVKNLEKIRQIPHRLYDRRKQAICQRALHGLRLHSPLPLDQDEKKIFSEIQKIFDKTRHLSAADFEVHKERLAEEFHALIKPLPKAENSVRRRVEFFLLSPHIIPILKQRISSSNG
jgi:hypothetical protein